MMTVGVATVGFGKTLRFSGSGVAAAEDARESVVSSSSNESMPRVGPFLRFFLTCLPLLDFLQF